MRFLSLFSGIEAASVALEPLGWSAVAFAEIEPAPCAILAAHYPHVPNLGDVTAITAEQIAALGPIDVVIGGSPCQDLSVAGNRKGLAGARSSLFYQQVRIFDAARSYCGARWMWWENVPGAFSTHGGRDFACVVSALAGCDILTPAGGWRTEGAAVGPDGVVEWSVLDAQWFGLAQRRARVFVVLDTGDWSNRPPVLLEPESLRGDHPPRREAGKGVAPTISARTKGGGGIGTDFDRDGGLIPERERALTTSNQRIDAETETLIPLVSHTLSAVRGQACAHAADLETYIPQPYTLAIRGRGESYDLEYRQDGTANALLTPNGGRDEVREVPVAGAIGSIRRGDAKNETLLAAPVAFHNRQDPDVSGDVTHSLGAKDNGMGVNMGMSVRRLTPRECERLQGFPDDYTLIQYRGKPAADGPRYKALGNSMAVPVIQWIGRNIQRAHYAVDCEVA